MQFVGELIRLLTAQHLILYFGGPKQQKAAAPKAAAPAPAAIAPPKEGDTPTAVFNPEAERQGTVRRSDFVLGSGQRRKTFGQSTTLGAGL